MSVFESKEVMPPMDNSPDVCRTALTMPEAKRNLTPAGYGMTDYASVKNVERPRFGHKAD